MLPKVCAAYLHGLSVLTVCNLGRSAVRMWGFENLSSGYLEFSVLGAAYSLQESQEGDASRPGNCMGFREWWKVQYRGLNNYIVGGGFLFVVIG